MTERSANPPAKPPAKPPAQPPRAQGAPRTATRTGSERANGEDTAVRAPLRERIQAKVANATDEHRANAEPESSGAALKAAGQGKPPRRARLRMTRIDPWSVMKTAFLLSIAFGVVTVVSVMMVWSVLGAAGVWEEINRTIQDSIGGTETANFDIENYVGASRVVGFTMLVAAVDVVLLTAIATLGAFLYNMAAALLGGIEVTLAEDHS